MAYLILAWVSATIGFVLGAAWAGLGMKNKQIDERIAGSVEESYSKAQRQTMMAE